MALLQTGAEYVRFHFPGKVGDSNQVSRALLLRLLLDECRVSICVAWFKATDTQCIAQRMQARTL